MPFFLPILSFILVLAPVSGGRGPLALRDTPWAFPNPLLPNISLSEFLIFSGQINIHEFNDQTSDRQPTRLIAQSSS